MEKKALSAKTVDVFKPKIKRYDVHDLLCPGLPAPPSCHPVPCASWMMPMLCDRWIWAAATPCGKRGKRRREACLCSNMPTFANLATNRTPGFSPFSLGRR